MLRCEAIADQTDKEMSESHDTVRRLLEMASSWRVRVAPQRGERGRERVAPPDLTGGSSTKPTSQILEQIGTGAEARATSGNSAICESCAGKQTENAARPDDPRIVPGTPQERNQAEVRAHDLEQDTETKAYTSESLTMCLSHMQQRWREGQRKALSCLTLNKSVRKT